MKFSEFVADPLVPHVHWDSPLNYLMIVWLDINVEQFLTILADLN